MVWFSWYSVVVHGWFGIGTSVGIDIGTRNGVSRVKVLLV